MFSPFLNPGSTTQDGQLALLHLRRDQCLPTVLSASPSSAAKTGYAEGVVTNTRFGSFPHSTLIDLPWGSQIRASEVDTGSRGRVGPLGQNVGKKRKVEESEVLNTEVDSFIPKEAVVASSGFVHVLPPTPENWTTSLPHRTQVVYTPDYSYILHRLRVRPSSVIIEAGSGSGSFTHAATRAVFGGYWDHNESPNGQKPPRCSLGRVHSYEFHSERFSKVTAELKEHGLDSIVHTIHRDVYSDGFALDLDGSKGRVSVSASAIFLDLPAPWQALSHLSRHPPNGEPSMLDPLQPVHICTFSPCIEQAQKTVSALRQHGWLDIDVAEIQQRRIEVKREYTGLQYEGLRGINAVAADIDQALAKLIDIERRAKEFHTGTSVRGDEHLGTSKTQQHVLRTERKALFNEGTIVHRCEPELKTHTSYLVFAVLPRAWTEEAENKARIAWKGAMASHSDVPNSQRQLKREAKQKARANEARVDPENKDNS